MGRSTNPKFHHEFTIPHRVSCWYHPLSTAGTRKAKIGAKLPWRGLGGDPSQKQVEKLQLTTILVGLWITLYYFSIFWPFLGLFLVVFLTS